MRVWSAIVVSTVASAQFGRREGLDIPINSATYLLTGLAGPVGHSGGHGENMSLVVAIKTIRKLKRLAATLDARVLIIGADDTFKNAIQAVGCYRCNFQHEDSHGKTATSLPPATSCPDDIDH